MKYGLLARFCIRWFISSLGIWIAAGLLGDQLNYDERLTVIVVAGFVLAVVNSLIKPIVVLLSLPAILFSLGLFMIVINGLMVVIAGWLYPALHVTNFVAAMLAGMIIGLVNYLVNSILED